MLSADNLFLATQKSCDAIAFAVRSSWLNVAFGSVLNHNGFLTSDPLTDVYTHLHYDCPIRAADNYGTYYMSILVQAGVATFDLKKDLDNINVPLTKRRRRSKKEMPITVDDCDNDTTKESKEDRNTLFEKLKYLEKLHDIPSITSLRAFLVKDFIESTTPDLYLFQSILQDLYLLQPWTQPLCFDENQEVYKQSLLQKTVVDLSGDNRSAEIQSLDSCNFSSLKKPAGQKKTSSGQDHTRMKLPLSTASTKQVKNTSKKIVSTNTEIPKQHKSQSSKLSQQAASNRVPKNTRQSLVPNASSSSKGTLLQPIHSYLLTSYLPYVFTTAI